MLVLTPQPHLRFCFSLFVSGRYFILSGTNLCYFTSEREIIFEPRGVLTIPGCSVALNPSTPPTRGPFIFTITDPDGIHLLTLKADRQKDAVMWLSGFQSHGCEVEGLEMLNNQQQQQQQQQREGQFGAERAASLPAVLSGAGGEGSIAAAGTAAAGAGPPGAPVKTEKGEGGAGPRGLRPKLPLFRLQSER